jgi:hypothetical protein
MSHVTVIDLYSCSRDYSACETWGKRAQIPKFSNFSPQLYKFLYTSTVSLDGCTEHLVVPFVKNQQMLKEVVNVLLIRSKFLPRHVSAYGCHPQRVVSTWWEATQAMFCVMGVCGLWPVPCSQLSSTTGYTGHWHTPVTQNIAWVALHQALTTPRGWQPYAETCRGRNLERINKNPLLPWAFVGLFANFYRLLVCNWGLWISVPFCYKKIDTSDRNSLNNFSIFFVFLFCATEVSA